MNKNENKIVHFFNSLDEKVKQTLKSLAAEVKDEKFSDMEEGAGQAPSYTEVPLVDGTVVKVTALEVGGEVIVVTPEGEIPAPEGEHQLADGTVIVTVKEGEKSVIKEIKPAEEMKKDVPTQKAQFAAIKEEFAAFKNEVLEENKKLKSEVEGLKLKLSKSNAMIKNTVEVIEAMAAVPTAEPIKKPEIAATASKKQRLLDKLK